MATPMTVQERIAARNQAQTQTQTQAHQAWSQPPAQPQAPPLPSTWSAPLPPPVPPAGDRDQPNTPTFVNPMGRSHNQLAGDRRRGWKIAGSILAGLFVLALIGSALGAGSEDEGTALTNGFDFSPAEGGASDLTCKMTADLPVDPQARVGYLWVVNGTITNSDAPALQAAARRFGAADALSDAELAASKALVAELRAACP